MFANVILSIAYLAVAAWVFWWLAPRSRRMRMDHLTSAILGLIWPVVFIWVAMVCACEMLRPDYKED